MFPETRPLRGHRGSGSPGASPPRPVDGRLTPGETRRCRAAGGEKTGGLQVSRGPGRCQRWGGDPGGTCSWGKRWATTRPALSETDSELARELERVESQAVREWGSGAPKDYFQTGNRSQKDHFQKGTQAHWSGTTHPAGWPPDREDCGRCGLLPLRAPSWGIKGTRSEVVFWHKPSTTARSGRCGSHTALRTRAGNWALVIV